MKVGDLVRWGPFTWDDDVDKAGVVVEMTQKKCWRSEIRGEMIDWNAIDPEPHAVVLFSMDDGTISIPAIDLEVV